ncbi:MAG: DNA mismatch repair protein MutS [Clostridia bacterium]|nr:DNA mismatch repair protein MutS [Clostridia bacterium]
MSKLSPLMQQYLQVKEEHRDCILMFRLGDFYEMFFDDAKLASSILGLVLAGRDCGLEERAPMCGVPHHSVDSYIGKLVNSGHKVAICEQLSDPKASRGLVDRDVVRIISPGTVIEESMLSGKENSYIAAIGFMNGGIGFSYADLSTGDLFTIEFLGAHAAEQLANELARIDPREIIANSSSEESMHAYKLSAYVQFVPDRQFSLSNAISLLHDQFGVVSLNGFGYNEGGDFGLNAAVALIKYLRDTQKNSLSHIRSIKRVNTRSYLQLDATTRMNLELVRPLRFDGKKNATLLYLLDKTKTAMGGRLLRSWIDQPLVIMSAICERLDTVEALYDDIVTAEGIASALSGVFDIERLCSRIAYGTINPKECRAIGQSLKVLPEIHALIRGIKSRHMQTIANEFDCLEDIEGMLNAAICDDPPIALKDGGIFRDGFDAEIDKLRAASSDSKQWLANLEARERENTGIKTLKVKYNRVFGYYFEVSKSFQHLVPERFERRQTISNAERYTSPELKSMEDVILGADVKRIELEYERFVELRAQLFACLERIKRTAELIALIDAYQSLSRVALENHYCKPALNNQGRIDIVDGRHPVVETFAGERFIANSAHMDNDDNRVLIITGPNMAGKSTYMRQVALITLMAHIGSFVPAKSADICIVDRIFTRIGASDSLSTGQSTFMVEMSEVANILNNATEKSLLIFDEIGRGTSTYDGLSIAWAVLEFVVDKRLCGAKALFATHYHELSELEGHLDGVVNFRVAVKEMGDSVVFLRKITRGSADKSFGIQVAKLAGLPVEVLQRARAILAQLESADVNREARVDVNSGSLHESGSDIGTALISRLRKVSPETITPIEALLLINELCEIADKEDTPG